MRKLTHTMAQVGGVSVTDEEAIEMELNGVD